MNRKKLIAPFLAGALMLGLLPATPVWAAANKAVEVPVNFTNSSWDDDWDTTSRTQLEVWNISELSSYSESYTVSYKLYIPESFIKEESAVNLGSSVVFNDASGEEWKYAGYADCPSAEFQSDGRFTVWNEATQKDVEIDYATAKKSGGYWVFSYENTSGALNTENAKADVSAASSVAVNFNLSIKGINITAKNAAVYLDDLKIVKADGTVVADQNFDNAKGLTDLGEARVAPKLEDADAKALKIATVPSTVKKTLKVSKTKLNVKAGKKVTIKATTTPKAKITYTSSNKKVATVSSKGVVTGKKAGTATITVKANGKTVKVKVTVKK